MPAWTDAGQQVPDQGRAGGLDRGADPHRSPAAARRAGGGPAGDGAEPPRPRTQSSDAAGRPLEERTIDELYRLARQLKIEGRCRMTREQLVSAIRSRRSG